MDLKEMQNQVAREAADEVVQQWQAVWHEVDEPDEAIEHLVEEIVWDHVPAMLYEMAERHEHDARAMNEISEWVHGATSAAVEIVMMAGD